MQNTETEIVQFRRRHAERKAEKPILGPPVDKIKEIPITLLSGELTGMKRKSLELALFTAVMTGNKSNTFRNKLFLKPMVKITLAEE